jgi:hypothetical protein
MSQDDQQRRQLTSLSPFGQRVFDFGERSLA